MSMASESDRASAATAAAGPSPDLIALSAPDAARVVAPPIPPDRVGLLASLAAGLRDQYTLERELGQGGMATVFLAHDLKHDRPVALKVLHPELASPAGAARFAREIRVTARLQHPHILTVLDSGKTAGQLWYTMPYVDGESLRQRLQREGRLPVDDALRLTRETAQALQYAHEHGVAHRDIKPENLLLTRDGNTLVADFGIARAFEGEDPRLTQARAGLGTPAYMSPEQAGGDEPLDARTDIYSLGCVLFEMLAGEPPFAGPSARAILLKCITEPLPSVRTFRPGVPESVDAAIRRAIAPLPADRFPEVADFAEALLSNPVGTSALAMTTPSAREPNPVARAGTRPPSRFTALGLGFLLGLGAFFAWKQGQLPSHKDTRPKVVAVLPFENLGDSADAYFADGVTEAAPSSRKSPDSRSSPARARMSTGAARSARRTSLANWAAIICSPRPCGGRGCPPE